MSTARAVRDADVQIVGGGTVFLFVLLTSVARGWVDDNVRADHQMLGDSLAVEHRYAQALAAGMQEAGLVLEAEEVRS